jgi:ABC-type transporter Mla MlaB component
MVVELPTEVTLARIREVREQLVGALAAGEDLELGVARVEQVDVTGLQLLCALHKSLAAQGKTLVCRDGATATLGAVASRAGFRPGAGCLPGCLWRDERP